VVLWGRVLSFFYTSVFVFDRIFDLGTQRYLPFLVGGWRPLSRQVSARREVLPVTDIRTDDSVHCNRRLGPRSATPSPDRKVLLESNSEKYGDEHYFQDPQKIIYIRFDSNVTGKNIHIIVGE